MLRCLSDWRILIIFPGSDDDLEYYVRECGDILGVTSNLPQDSRDAKHILEYIFTHVVEFKKLNQVWFLLSVLIYFLPMLPYETCTCRSVENNSDNHCLQEQDYDTTQFGGGGGYGQY